jgi:TPR repeat protein
LRRALTCAAAATALSLAGAGSSFANYEQGLEAYRDGHYDLAIDIWKKFAVAGDVRSKQALGEVYSDSVCEERELERMSRKGYGASAPVEAKPSKVVPTNNVEALKWYILAAFHDFGDPKYANPMPEEVNARIVANLCLPAVRAEMSTADVRKAETLAAQNFERGSPRDLYLLGRMFQRGDGVQKDNQRALQMYELAKMKGVGEASQAYDKLLSVATADEQTNARKDVVAWQPPLPELYDSDPPLKKEYERLKKELEQLRGQDALEAVSDIDVELLQRALKALGFYYGAPDNKMGPETRAAIRRFQFSQYGNKPGLTVEEKESVKTGVLSAQQTVDLIREAANAEHPMSEYVYGIMNARGVGVIQNGDEAVKWLTKAANADLALAHYALGVLYRDGTTGLNEVTPDKAKAARHFARAFALGYKPAGDALKLLEFEAPRQVE